MSAARRPSSIRVSRDVLRGAVAIALLLALAVALSFAASAAGPRIVADQAELAVQQGAAERAVQRIYAAGIEQLRTTRSLRLAISDSQAAEIEKKYADQLAALRRSALQAMGTASGLSADASTQYAQQAETRLAAALPSSPPVMLAPRLYTIVERMGQLTSQLTDQGIREMTQSTPPASPSSTPRATASPSPSPSR